MSQPIAGVAPATLEEVTVMTVWPTLAATRGGRWWGRRYENTFGFRLLGIPITIGRIVAILSIPLILPPYFLTLIPGFGVPKVFSWIPGFLWIENPLCRNYRVTNQHVIVEHALGGAEQRSVSLDRFDAVDVEVLPGQEWYHAGELVFRQGTVETFRLHGVPRPETFRHTCLKAQQSFAGVQQARLAGAAV